MDKLIITSAEYPQLRLRTIDESDLEELRVWKNFNKASFFFREEITPSMQEAWFRKYSLSDNGYMLMVEEILPDKIHKIGCLAYRKIISGGVDLYNIIRGHESLSGQKISDAMKIMLVFISIWEKEISCKVLKNNPAQNWYEKIGFEISETFDEYFLLKPQKNFSLDLHIKSY